MDKKNEYAEKLKDPRWQKKRLEILQRDSFRCQQCQDSKSTLHVHHRRYFPNKDPWDIPNDCLVTLCETCHQEQTDQLPDVTHDLVAIVKQKFFAADIKVIAQALLSVPVFGDSAYTACVIEYFLGDKERFSKLHEEYGKHLSNSGNSE